MNSSREIQFDYIRSLAIVFVIFIHSMGWINNINTLNIAYIIRVTLDSVIYTGVPLFVMLSGALLLGKEETISQFFSKRFKRIIIPFILWSLLVYAILYIQEGGNIFFEYINSYITKTLTSGVYGIYWYIYLIVGLYIITPFLRKICKDKNICIYTITIIYTFYVVQRIFPEVAVCNRFSCDNLLYIGYYITGYAINKYFKQYKGFKITSILLLISFITTYIFVSLIIKHLGIGGGKLYQ